MNVPKNSPEPGPGHYGAGYGEQAPADTPARPAPTPPVDADVDSANASGSTTAGDDGAPVVFTPDDVGVRPPDQPPTENAPASEKAGLIFERS